MDLDAIRSREVAVLADMPSRTEPDHADGEAHERRPRPPTPRWVMVLAIIAVGLILAFVVSRFAGVQHGPGLHSSVDGAAGGALPLLVTRAS